MHGRLSQPGSYEKRKTVEMKKEIMTTAGNQ
jgi:hypothetical protein